MNPPALDHLPQNLFFPTVTTNFLFPSGNLQMLERSPGHQLSRTAPSHSAIYIVIGLHHRSLMARGRAPRLSLSRGSAGQVNVDAPPAIFRFDEGGCSQQGRLYRSGGPSQSKDSHADATAIASEPSRMHTRTAKWTMQITIQNTRMAIAPIWRSQMFITPVTSVRSMYEDKHYTASPSPQFTIPKRGRNA